MKKNVLFIINRFAPPITGGTIRLYKFIKYLLRFGWDIFVICNAIDKERMVLSDSTAKRDLKGLHVFSIPALDEKLYHIKTL